MMSSYFLEIATGVDYERLEYDMAAGRISGMLVAILSDRAVVDSLTYGAPRDSCHSCIEVLLANEPRELIARVVVDITAQDKVKFDKPAFSRLVRDSEWPDSKISKRHVPTVPESFGS